jgi:virginiamycin B lyase
MIIGISGIVVLLGSLLVSNDLRSVLKPKPPGTLVEFLVPTAHARPANVIAGPDGRLWFTEPSLPTHHSPPSGIAAGPDGNMWCTEESGDRSHA